MTRWAALLLTVLTGFSGLAYEVTWEKYLATLLGSHSEATASVLGIFLGGLSVGYWLFGAVTRTVVQRAEERGEAPRLLLLYGLVEGGIGLYVLLFPLLFRGAQAISIWGPQGVPGLGFAFDVLLAALLIGPPTVLMGGTIPVLTQALARSREDATRFHAFVYAFNTVGAFFGALAAGFVLIPALGLARMMWAMGCINLAAGAIFIGLGLRRPPHARLEPEAPGETRVKGRGAFAAAALCVGFAMMAIQTTLIRIGGLSLGASQFTFSMVVAVFVLCIALGSFLVSALPRIRPVTLPAVFWGLTGLLYLIYRPLQDMPYWAYVLRSFFRDTDASFYVFQLNAFLGLFLLIGLPVALSGATLPLLFHQLRREFEGLGASAGTLYSWNTLGSLLGALLGGYVLLFWLDLHHVYRVALATLALASIVVTVRVFGLGRAGGAILVAAAAGGLLLLDPWAPERLAVGTFRYRQPGPLTYQGPAAFRRPAKLVFHDDDPTATIAVKDSKVRGKPARTILTNGKSDGNTEGDYITMALAALLPALFAEQAERALLIGYGTGVTAGELAALASMREVLVAEISPGVVRAAPLFDFANMGASKNGRIRIVRSDAYRVLRSSRDHFDVIVSEPSNPWVTGVEMLFSREFLEIARERLNPGGVYAQWFHQYETDDASVGLVLRTYASVFDHVSVWYATGPDLILLGFRDAERALDLGRLERRASRPDFASGLRRSGIGSFPALLAHELLPIGVLHAADLDGPIHTLYHPRLSHQAGRAFHRGAEADLPFTGFGDAASLGARNSLLRLRAERSGGRLPDAERSQVIDEACRWRSQHCLGLLAEWAAEQPDLGTVRRRIAALRRVGRNVDEPTLRQLARLHGGDGAGGEPIPLATARRLTQLFTEFYAHSAPADGEALVRDWKRCQAPARAPKACARGLASARALLSGGRAGVIAEAGGKPTDAND